MYENLSGRFSWINGRNCRTVLSPIAANAANRRRSIAAAGIGTAGGTSVLSGGVCAASVSGILRRIQPDAFQPCFAGGPSAPVPHVKTSTTCSASADGWPAGAGHSMRANESE